MKILITGGAGFIGSHVAERLLQEDHEVSIIDDLNDFYSPAEKLDNLAMVRNSGPVRLYQCDICDHEQISRIVRDTAPEIVIHFAARAGVRPSLEQPLLYERVNVGGTAGLLEISRQLGVRKFLFASSSSIYGIANRVPFSEDDHLNLPISPYAATKISGEKFCFTYSHLYGLSSICLRFFTVYGPRQRPDLAIRKFTERIDRGQTIPVFGDGSSGRDYTYIDDIVQGVMAALLYDCSYEVFNLGNSQPVELGALIRKLEEALNRKAVIQRLPEQPGDVPITYANTQKAQSLLKYHPQTPFGEGIHKFVDWYRAKKHVQAVR